MEPDPWVLCLYFREEAGLLFLFKIGCHGGFIRAFALMKIVCISDAAALATQCLHLPAAEQQVSSWNLALHLGTPNRCHKHPGTPGWHTWGQDQPPHRWCECLQLLGLQTPQTKWKCCSESPGPGGSSLRCDPGVRFGFCSTTWNFWEVSALMFWKWWEALPDIQICWCKSLSHFLMSLSH